MYPSVVAFSRLSRPSGAGGFSLGFGQAGASIVGAIEIDKWATDTFSHNHPDAIIANEDITELTDADIRSLFANQTPTILLGGPPCQGFSVCNKQAGDPKDPRNTLFRDFIRIGKIFEPKLMVMENVPNLKSAKTHDKERVIDIIVGELGNLGYHVYSNVLQATDYGVSFPVK